MPFSEAPRPANVRRFWAWFGETAPELVGLLQRGDSSRLAKLVQPAVDALDGGFGWEIGPAETEQWFFALTFRGCPETMRRAREVVDRAPDVPGWKIQWGKPRRPSWNGQFVLYDWVGAAVSLDASTWRYRLTGFDRNAFFDIALYADTLPPLSETLQQQAAILVVESHVGEVLTVERFDRFSLEAPTPPDIAETLTPVHELQNHLRQLVGGS